MPRILGLFLLLVTGALTMGCFGSGAQTTHPAEFALASCSLGCSGETCAVNSIATNQQITLTFNDAVDPATV
ncbi:MAG: hypothetical protein MK213_01110, partial [Planctomycetes bacterium]|nr:hypothetical protein [Planctomycetota bacterium]